MDQQNIIDILISICGAGVVWWVKTLWDKQELQAKTLQDMHLEMVKNYVPRTELEKALEKLFDGIDGIQKEIKHLSNNQAQLKVYRDLQSREPHHDR